MAIRKISGRVEEGAEIKAVGDVIIVDGVKYTVDEINTYHDEIDGLHHFDYTVKAFVEVEPTLEELQQL